MELAKITTQGQITIPSAIRKKLGVHAGDKVLFVEENGQIVIKSANMLAFQQIQEAFAGEAERLGLKSMEDVVNLVKEIRMERNK